MTGRRSRAPVNTERQKSAGKVKTRVDGSQRLNQTREITTQNIRQTEDKMFLSTIQISF